MTAKELAEKILREIAGGRLNPNAVVVRPFCMCDEEVGYIEAAFLDQVSRRWEPADVDSGGRIYKYGSRIEPGDEVAVTLKLG